MTPKRTILITIIMVVLVSQIVNAGPAAFTPTCEVTANVLKVERQWHFFVYELGNYYKISLDISEISTYREGPCDSKYAEYVEKSGAILFQGEYDKNPVSEGQKIKAKIRYGGDERFNGNFLSDIEILEGTTKDKKQAIPPIPVLPIILVIFIAIISYVLLKKLKKEKRSK